MKKIKITLLLFVLGLGYSYAQDHLEVKKVESPYRLLKGVTLVNDLRMTTTTLNGVDKTMYERPSNAFGNNTTNFGNNEISPFWRQSGATLGQYRTLFPAIVVDGLLINDNSQRLNPVAFPTFDLTW